MFIVVFWRAHRKTSNLSRMSPFCSLTPHFFKVCFNIVLLSISVCHRWSLLLRFSDWNLVSFVIYAMCPICAACPIVLHFKFCALSGLCCVSHLCYISHFCCMYSGPVCPICATCPLHSMSHSCCMSNCPLCPVVLYVPCLPYVTLPCVSHICAACPFVLYVPCLLHVTLPCVSHSCCMWHYPVCPIHAACDITLCVPCTLHVTLPCVSPPMEAISFVSILWMCCGVVERELRTIVDNCCVRCEVLTVLWQRIEVLWDVMLCRWVSGSWYYRGILLLNCWSAEGEGTLFVQNIKNHSSINCVISWQILKLIQILLANILTLLPISGAACQYLLQTLLLLCSWVWFSQQ